ncbi:transcriptional regulator swi6, partial [Coemansia thaxteri]
SSPNTRREQAAVSAFNADGAGAAEAMAETESSQQLGSGSGSGTLGADSARNADFAAFLNLQDSRGDTALNVAARFGDRAVIRMLLNAGASATICNSVGICPLDFGVDKIVELDADSGAFLPSDSAPFDEGSPRFNPATPRTLRRGMSAARDFVPLGSPTPAARRQSRLPADSALLDAGADGAILQTPRRAAALGAKRGLLSSPPPGSGRPWGGSRGLLDSGATPSGPSEVWSPVSAELRMHQSVQNIQRIMSDLEADFSGEMRVKQVHFDGIKQQLRNTTIELAKARETIHELHAKTAQLGEIKSRLGYLEETLARETSAVRAAISELPSDSKPRLDLEGLLESLLTSPAADDGSVRDDAETLSYLPPVPGVDLGALASGGSDVDELAASDPEKLSALVEQMRIVNQVYARRDALLRERVAALRKRADV